MDLRTKNAKIKRARTFTAKEIYRYRYLIASVKNSKSKFYTRLLKVRILQILAGIIVCPFCGALK